MRFLTGVLFFLVVLASCGSERPAPGTGENTTTEEGPRTGDFYKRLTGTIAGKPVVMHLHRFGGEVSGSYSYSAVGIPIRLMSWSEGLGDTLRFIEWNAAGPVNLDAPAGEASLTLILSGSTATGQWMSADSARTYSVSLREAYEGGSLRLDAVSARDSGRLFAGKPAPQATASYASVIPEEDGKSAEWLNGQIRGLFGNEKATGSWPQFFKTLAAAYLNDYRSEVEIDTTEPGAVDHYMYNYTTDQSVRVVMNEADLLVLCSAGDDYTGGAHGMQTSTFLNLDAKMQRVWKLADVIEDTAALVSFLDGAARDRYGFGPEQSLRDHLFVEQVPVTENFYLTRTGLGFVYNPYEVASYAEGEVHLFIPYKRLTILLSEPFKQRMGLSGGAVMRG